MRFLNFPSGDDFWVVKWYDKRQQMHELSGSPSMEVLLQRLSIQDRKELRRMSQEDVGALFARKSFSRDPTFRIVRLDESSMPAIRIGQVFRDGKRVGDLPSSARFLDMPGGEMLMREITLGQELPKPADWTYSFRLLNPSQYDLPRDYNGSRCIVRTIHEGGRDIDVVIPRALVEQVFYFPDSVIIRAAAKGSWDQYKDDLVVLKKLDNGLETGICPETGSWKIVLRTEVRDQHALMMALFTHSPYAAKEANLIASNAAIERQQNRYAPWNASGRIPWDPSFGAYMLRLRGFVLSPSARKGSDTFLVTHITGMTAPEKLPIVRHERENSNRDSDAGEIDGERSRGGKSEKRGDPNRNIRSGRDANPEEGNEGFDTTATSWLIQPRMWKQDKENHTSLEGPRGQHSGNQNQSDEASTGRNSAQAGNPGKASMHSLPVLAVVSFIHLQNAMEALEKEGFIEHWCVVEPPYEGQRVDRDGLCCWNFLSSELRENSQKGGELPGRGWFMLNPREDLRRARAALVLQVQLKGAYIYWIEIERRPYESGMRSPILANVSEGISDSFIDHVLRAIGENEGADMAGVLEEITHAFGPPLATALYHHSYDTEKVETKPELDPAEIEVDPPDAEKEPLVTVKRKLGMKADSIKAVLRRVTASSDIGQ